MKKMLIIPAVIGLLAVPSFALAHNGVDNSPVVKTDSPLNIRHKDRKADNARMTTTPVAMHAEENASNTVGDDNDDDSAMPVVASEGSISLDQAKTIALGVLPGKTVKSVETEREHGVLVYSVRFTDDSQVDFQASNGAVLRIKSDTEGDISVGIDSDNNIHKHGNDNSHND